MNELNFPDEVFDNSSEEENHPELGSPSETQEETDLNPEDIDSTRDADGSILGDDEPETKEIAPEFLDDTNDGDGDLFDGDEE